MFSAIFAAALITTIISACTAFSAHRWAVITGSIYTAVLVVVMYILKLRTVTSDPQTAFFLLFASVFVNLLSAFMLMALGGALKLTLTPLLLTFVALYPAFYIFMSFYVFGDLKRAAPERH